jgi:hypothetical protein
VAWCLSGIVLMYAGVPHLTAGERLMRLPPLDLSTIHVTPTEAAASFKEPPRRLRISMHGNRPVYRFNTGRVFGRWTLVYADTGTPVEPLDREAALAWLRGYLPDQRTLRYDAYLDRPDTFTRLPAMQTHFPVHRVSLDDDAGTQYYVSARSGEAVMKSDRRTRLLGLFGYITHTFFFFRQQSWWSALLQWVSWIGLAMCLTGAVIGVWRYGLTPRFRHKRIPSHSPYTGWMKWHHYAGLLFGFFNHHLDVQRPRLTRRHSRHPRIEVLAAADCRRRARGARRGRGDRSLVPDTGDAAHRRGDGVVIVRTQGTRAAAVRQRAVPDRVSATNT